MKLCYSKTITKKVYDLTWFQKGSRTLLYIKTAIVLQVDSFKNVLWETILKCLKNYFQNFLISVLYISQIHNISLTLI